MKNLNSLVNVFTIALAFNVQTVSARESIEVTLDTPRIIGGEEATKGNYPYFIRTASTRVLCAAILVHEDIAISAAHCAGVFTDGVLVGATANNATGEDEGVEMIETEFEFQHPDYQRGLASRSSHDNDIMFIKLKSPSSATPIAYNTDRKIPAVGDTVKAIGLGVVSVIDRQRAQVLMEVNVTTVDGDDCSRLYGSGVDTDKMLCAGTPEGGKDSCYGDSGGPLIHPESGTVVGITSWGVSCAQAEYPGVYTKISNYADFIESGICEFSDNPPSTCFDNESSGNCASVYSCAEGGGYVKRRSGIFGCVDRCIEDSIENGFFRFLGRARRDFFSWECGKC